MNLHPRPEKIVAVRVRTWVNGELAQDAVSGQDLLFSFADIIADVTRLTTLEAGDVILTGTPAGSTVVSPGDVVEVEVTAGAATTGRLRSPVAEADYDLKPPGALPRADDAQRAAACGSRRAHDGRPQDDSPRDLLSAIGTVSTATLASQLKKRGYESVALDRLQVTRPELKMAGFARGDPTAGTVGDILAGDADGVVVIPRDVARQEQFITEQVAKGESVDGLYPIGAKWRPAYEAWLKESA